MHSQRHYWLCTCLLEAQVPAKCGGPLLYDFSFQTKCSKKAVESGLPIAVLRSGSPVLRFRLYQRPHNSKPCRCPAVGCSGFCSSASFRRLESCPCGHSDAGSFLVLRPMQHRYIFRPISLASHCRMSYGSSALASSSCLPSKYSRICQIPPLVRPMLILWPRKNIKNYKIKRVRLDRVQSPRVMVNRNFTALFRNFIVLIFCANLASVVRMTFMRYFQQRYYGTGVWTIS